MISGVEFLKVPKIEERQEIILKYHVLGHFAAGSTFDRIRTNYYWYKMLDQIGRVISECEPCIRNSQVKVFNHPAVAIESPRN